MNARIRSVVRRLYRYAMAILPARVGRFCVICNHRVLSFRPYKGGTKCQPPLMAVLHIVGSDLDNFSCPLCGAHDRERHLVMYLQRSNLLDRLHDATALHIAPENRFSEFLQAQAPRQYVQGDLWPSHSGIQKIDISAIPFEDNHFDFVFANHVLEHVGNLDGALSELRRVLKKGGFAILQTPYSARLNFTWADPAIDDDESRLQAYGQEDHVRLFGKDIFDRIVAAGFSSHVVTHATALADKDANHFGVNREEPFFLFEKAAE